MQSILYLPSFCGGFGVFLNNMTLFTTPCCSMVTLTVTRAVAISFKICIYLKEQRVRNLIRLGRIISRSLRGR